MAFIRGAARGVLALSLIFAGVGHLGFLRDEFQAQVPDWVPIDTDFVVVASGIVEILLGFALLVSRRLVPLAGLATAAFFIAIFPGNVHQYVAGIDAFGLETDQARFVRLLFQPILVLWALWSTRALSALPRLPAFRENRDNKN